ncbi:MAG: Rid family detoxifying hydrolase [Candidatus Bathyarchaeia archaeon]|jgi:2-iminobutanoate/2-iminopropanoate deaminase
MDLKKEVIVVDKLPKPTVPYSHCVKAGDFLFIAGQVGVDPANSKLKGSSIKEQTEQALTNMMTILKAARSSMEHVVKTTVFISDFKDFEEMNRVYARFFPTSQPARSTVQVVLYDGFKVEIEAIAIVPPMIERPKSSFL